MQVPPSRTTPSRTIQVRMGTGIPIHKVPDPDAVPSSTNLPTLGAGRPIGEAVPSDIAPGTPCQEHLSRVLRLPFPRSCIKTLRALVVSQSHSCSRSHYRACLCIDAKSFLSTLAPSKDFISPALLRPSLKRPTSSTPSLTAQKPAPTPKPSSNGAEHGRPGLPPTTSPTGSRDATLVVPALSLPAHPFTSVSPTRSREGISPPKSSLPRH